MQILGHTYIAHADLYVNNNLNFIFFKKNNLNFIVNIFIYRCGYVAPYIVLFYLLFTFQQIKNTTYYNKRISTIHLLNPHVIIHLIFKLIGYNK